IAVAFLFPVALAALAGGEGRAASVVAGVTLAAWGAAAATGAALLLYLWTTKVPGTQTNANLLYTGPLHALLVPLGLVLAVGRLSPWGARVLRGILWALFSLAAGDLCAHL